MSTGLSARSVGATDARQADRWLESAVEEGKIGRNPATYVIPPRHTPRERETWTGLEVRRFRYLASFPAFAARYARWPDRCCRQEHHDSRHTTLSLMEKAGVPISIVSKWAGHYDAAFTMRTYVHASDDELEQGRQALAKIHKIA